MNSKVMFAAAAATTLVSCNGQQAADSLKGSKPNVVIVFADDLGYNDWSCFGSPNIKTPNIDNIAANGVRYTDFYCSSSVSSASRAGLLSGKYNPNNGVNFVYFPGQVGLPPETETIAEVLKDCGYATACIGKWHVGDLDGYMPTDQGFDYYYGIPYSNDMYIGGTDTQKIADDCLFREGKTREQAIEDMAFVSKCKDFREVNTNKDVKHKVPLFENKEIVEYPCEQASTSRRYFDKAIEFIDKAGDQPFFTYITPAMPHIPLHATEQFAGKSERGLYGDVVEELDWNIGRLVKYLEETGRLENTLVIVTSDNGPWLDKGEDGGCADPLRGGKFTAYEGGFRMPCVAMWKGVIPAGVESDAIISSIDFLPTVAALGGKDVSDLGLDGIDFSGNLMHPQESHRDHYVYYFQNKIRGIRVGDWKYLPYAGAQKLDKTHPQLFNLKEDIAEQNNVIDQYPEVVEQLEKLMNEKNCLKK